MTSAGKMKCKEIIRLCSVLFYSILNVLENISFQQHSQRPTSGNDSPSPSPLADLTRPQQRTDVVRQPRAVQARADAAVARARGADGRAVGGAGEEETSRAR